MEENIRQKRLRIYATVFIILFGTYYTPLEGSAGFGFLKVSLMVTAIFVLLSYSLKISKALVCGVLYLFTQCFTASLHPETWRWSTYLFSCGLVLSYVCLYNLIYVERVFKIAYFLRLLKFFITLSFVVCIIQQLCIIAGMRVVPILNITSPLNRGIGCNSLFLEPSHFGRFMLVFYYAYLKCQEYLRGQGPFSIKELFSGEYKKTTLMFLWMMTTMGSGTAYACLLLLSLYFVRRNNWYYTIPLFLFIYFVVFPALHIEQLDRATKVTNAMTTLDQEQLEAADGSGASRLSPILNSFNADFTDVDTWFGHGIDYARKNNMVVRQTATLFDDYGLVFYIASLVFNLSCGYRFLSLSFIFMFAGVAGGAGSNIHYAWMLMIIMTCVRYFYENQNNPDIYEESLNEESEPDIESIEYEE